MKTELFIDGLLLPAVEGPCISVLDPARVQVIAEVASGAHNGLLEFMERKYFAVEW